jgi:hypothetical protein
VSRGAATLLRWAGRGWAIGQLPVVRRTAGLLAVLGYVLVSLWPFTWDPPERVANGARIAAQGGLEFTTPGLALTPDPPPWLQAAQRDGHLEITLRVRPQLTRQSGPARILSVSGSGFDRNLLIGQQGDDLVVHLRTSDPGAGDGAREAERRVRARDIFAAGRWLDLALTVRPRELALRVGEQREIRRELPPDPLRTWNAGYRLSLGSEITGSHPWLGDIGGLVVRTSGGSYAYPEGASLERPAHFWIMSRDPKLQPLRHLGVRDTINNLLLYLPLGLFLAVSPRGGTTSAALTSLLLIAGLSASMELAQVFVSSRNPSINDFILNVAGGAVGYAAGRALASRAECLWGAGNPTVTRSG